MVPLYSGEKSRNASEGLGGGAQARGGLRDAALDVDVLVVERDLGQTLEDLDVRALGRELDGRLGELAIGRTGAKAADEREDANRHANSKDSETVP